MLTLGLAGGLDPVYEARLDTPENFTYDGAAVLLEDGEVVAAIEEARVDRIRRSNKFPAAAIRFCLEQRGIALGDLDQIAYYAPEAAANFLLSRLYIAMPEIEARLDARGLLAATLRHELGAAIDPTRLRFYQHKLAHAASALVQSGFDQALVLVLDNSGGLFRAARGERGTIRCEEIVAIPSANSTTRMCMTLLPFLGLGPLDDTRAVAMAPEGDPAAFRALFKKLYDLLPDGGYTLHLERVAQLVGRIEPCGRQGPGQQHKDLAAAFQEAQEDIVFHLLRHHLAATGLRRLCLAGGIVENSRTNGKVLASGLCDEVFVHPAVSDAGCALGVALMAAEEAGQTLPRTRLRHVYWGTEAGDGSGLAAWSAFLRAERDEDPARRAAQLVAQGALIGWVQGRSEFSPRALGNRSVLADPRPEENRARVDAALHRVPGAVAIAPSVLEEEAGSFFELPAETSSLPFMAFGVKARDAARTALAATLFADGTAWLQTVSQETNPRYFRLIEAFKDLTGIPAVLTTSFSSRSEPIVDSLEDAVVAFLTSDLDGLVVGDFVASKLPAEPADWLALYASLPSYVRLQRTRRFVTADRMKASCQLRTTYDAALAVPLSDALFEVLMAIDVESPLADLFRAAGIAGTEAISPLLRELRELWAQRLVRLRPGRAATA